MRLCAVFGTDLKLPWIIQVRLINTVTVSCPRNSGSIKASKRKFRTAECGVDECFPKPAIAVLSAASEHSLAAQGWRSSCVQIMKTGEGETPPTEKGNPSPLRTNTPNQMVQHNIYPFGQERNVQVA